MPYMARLIVPGDVVAVRALTRIDQAMTVTDVPT